jgi:PP-loop superfamily ATP-utilizing enzyme
MSSASMRSGLDRLLPFKPRIQEAFVQLGFETATIDTEGFVSGKLNRAIISDG